MRVLVVGGTGLIGSAVVEQLRGAHEVIAATRKDTPLRVDITQPESIRAMYAQVGRVDAVVGCAGSAAWKPLAELTDEDFAGALAYKLMGQVNLVRLGWDAVRDGGSFTLTSGVLAQVPQRGGAAYAVVNAGVEAFARSAALEAPRGIRVNVVSPPWIAETLRAMGQDPAQGLPAATVAPSYVAAVTGTMSGETIVPRG